MSSDKVNWEQARVDGAIGAMQGIVANTHDRDYRVCEMHPSYNSWRKKYPNEIAKTAVAIADALIAELQRVETKRKQLICKQQFLRKILSMHSR